jgi:hypothetical protein
MRRESLAACSLTLLGGFALRSPDGKDLPLPTRKDRLLLAYLALSAGRLLARDRLGIKPLYYALDGDGTLYFASEIKALIEARAVAPEINYAALPDYLANHAPSGEETLFSGFKRLLPGHTLTWRDGQIEIRKYWDLSFAQNGHPALSDRGAIVRIRKEHPRIVGFAFAE